MTPDAFPGSESGFLALLGVRGCVGRSPGSPSRVAVSRCKRVRDDLRVRPGTCGCFGAVLHELANAHRDSAVTVAGIEPEPAHYRNAYGFFPAFRFATGTVRTGYGAALF